MAAILYWVQFATTVFSPMWALIGFRSLGAVAVTAALLGLFGCEQRPDPIASSGPVAADVPAGSVTVPSRPDRDRPSDGLPRIVAFGDSLTAGLGVPSEESYPSELQRRLDRAGYRYRVINAGVSGDTTAGGVRRLDWVLKSRPRIVIVELGANDGLRGLNLSETRRNLEQIIQRLQSAGVTVALAGMRLPPNYGADYTGRFAALYPDLARRYRLVLMPFFLEGVAARASLNQADGIHPTGAGYRVIVDHLLPILEPLLEKPRAE